MRKPAKKWKADDYLELGKSYQAAAVYFAAAELDIFGRLAEGPRDAKTLAKGLRCDLRGMTTLLDALAGLQLIRKTGGRYALSRGAEKFLTAKGPQSVLAMAQHQANCLRNWAQLAMVVKTGRPAEKIKTVRGPEGDAASFIGAMDNISAPMAGQVIRGVKPLKFKHLLDVGGASGTWAIAFLRACPEATGTLFDLPHVIPMAKERLTEAGMEDRVTLVPGDFMRDKLPGGADLAWVSAIVHQNSRQENRALFRKVYQGLAPGGRIAIRDILMDRSRTQPTSGALFAINMLVATAGGGTFTFEELREDLASAGFTQARVLQQDEGMNAIVAAKK